MALTKLQFGRGRGAGRAYAGAMAWRFLSLALFTGITIVQAQASTNPATAQYLACEAQRQTQMTGIREALQAAQLPFAVGSFGYDQSGCVVKDIEGAGTVSAAQVKETLARAGFALEVVSTPLPVFAPAQGRVKLDLLLPLRVPHGQNLTLNLRWHGKANSILWPDGVLIEYLILDAAGQPVRWSESTLRGLVAFICHAPCAVPLRLELPLNHFQAGLPLEAGQYALRLQLPVKDATGQRETLPDIPFEILP